MQQKKQYCSQGNKLVDIIAIFALGTKHLKLNFQAQGRGKK